MASVTLDSALKWRPRRKWHEPPYYKVQTWDSVGQAWVDEKQAFDFIEEAREYIRRNIAPDLKTRLMHVTKDGRSPLPDCGPDV